MTNPVILISRQEIKKTIAKLAKQIRKDYEGKNPVIISVLKGSAVFFADLIRELNIPLQIEFVQVSSYGSGTESSGKIKVIQRLRTSIKDRHVLVIEDIVDTGNTLSYLLKYLARKKPASLKLCALTDKPSRRKVPVKIDYLGFTVPDKFIVGYGIDFNEEYRYLPDICVIN
jgi:hypoxanthine phosphoribosyltransferase